MPFDSTNYQPIPEGHRRLLVLAEFLETKVPSERFDLKGWTNGSGRAVEMGDCGTAGCALGWANAIPEFRTTGFSCPAFKGPSFAGLTGFQAARVFFDVPHGTDGETRFTDMFMHGSYEHAPSPVEVAARIRAFVAERAKVTA